MMRSRRSFLSSVPLVGLAVGLTGCAGWWEAFKKNPAAQTESIIQTVSTILQVATTVFGGIKPHLPADKQDIAQQKFDQAMVAAQHSIETVRAAVHAAAEAQQDNPDFSKLIAEMTKAVEGIQKLVDDFRALAGASKPGLVGAGGEYKPVGYDDMVGMIGSYKQRVGAE
jgi:hypothetical protein